ncbi:helix-turn-helix transcriptional regulator [Paenibacillus sp. PK3_47]|nr:helix-turn-helix transcriptional regulator [Paenibacillus sp. PK3_47]
MINILKQLDTDRQEYKWTSKEYREAVIDKLRKAVPFTAACCTTTDPHTLLSTGAVTGQGLTELHPLLFQYEYLREDYMKYEQLATATVPVACLSGVTEGKPERSARYMNVLQPAGLGDELRAALVSGGACWGFLTLFRSAHELPFQEEECRIIAAAVPLIAAVLRSYAAGLPYDQPDTVPEDNGILILNDSLLQLSANDAANHWLDKLRRLEELDSGVLPRPVNAVCLRALAAEMGDGGASAPASLCLRLENGAYLTVTASRLEATGGKKELAVTFVCAKSSDIFRLLADACVLTPREKELAEMLSRGLSTKELAESLYISAYTVQDHLKSIFRKTGVTSRRELTTRLFPHK